MELEFLELEFQNATIGSLKRQYRTPEFLFFIFYFQFIITRLSKNQISKQRHFPN